MEENSKEKESWILLKIYEREKRKDKKDLKILKILLL